MQCPFVVGQKVAWSSDAPLDWKLVHTPGPMTVVSFRWSDGLPTQYSLMFGPNGFDFKPGWIITVEYEADSTEYYNPPRSLLFQSNVIQKEFHQMWLKAT